MLKVTNKDLQFAKRLKRLRHKSNYTQEELAAKARLSTTFVGLLETGKRKPSLKSLQRIASALNVKVNELLPY